ncbi:sensor histidine kinase [Chamaesiphon polymorphus]|nr:sensor histidine kinase [Chamaesiphon polymorphus]
MPTPASSEFMALCRAQLRLLAEGLGASLSVVYMTQELEGGGESKLLPLVVYPEAGGGWSEVMDRAISDRSVLSTPSIATEPKSDRSNRENRHRRYTNVESARQIADRNSQLATFAPLQSPERTAEDDRSKRHQLLLPLVSEGTILGLLATTRETQPWNSLEQTEIKHIAQTIALAGIIDRKHNWLRLELQQQQQLQLQQQNLLHNLLHQLRNPLTAIRTFGKLLIKRLQIGETDRGFASSIVRESDRLQELLTHLENAIDLPLIKDSDAKTDRIKPLPSSQEEANVSNANLLLPDAAFRIESCQLTDVLDPLITSAEAIAQDRNLTFYTHIPRDLPLVQAHPAALREVLSNLIDNALKYTPAGGEVDVDVELVATAIDLPDVPQPARIQICIRDTGVGIPAQDLDKLFTRHYRGVQAQGSIAGTGLGLAIAKELVTHMHGKLEVKSPPPGDDRGTEFMLWLQLVNDG